MIDLRRIGLLAVAPVIAAITIAIVSSQPSGAARDVAQVEQAAQVAAVQPATSAASAAEPAKATEGASDRDSIKVHGHWTIAVLDPDGSAVDSRDFENALVLTGGQAMGVFLGRQNSVGFWTIRLQSSGPGPCTSSALGPIGCDIDEPASGATTNSYRFATLQLNLPTTGPDAYKLRLTGTATAQNASSLDQVATLVSFCPIGTSAAANQCSGTVPFSAKLFLANTSAPPVTVQPGQQIQVTVVISFS